MATLPTFTVSDATAQRLMAAFEGEIDEVAGVALTPAQAYKRWLRDQLTRKVLAHEAAASEAGLTVGLPL